MNRILPPLLAVILGASIVCAQEQSNDTEYQDMAQLRRKLVRMKKEMDSFMRDIVQTYPSAAMDTERDFSGDVRVDITEHENEMLVRADLPGMDKDRIDVSLENNRMLKISGSRDALKKESSPGIVRQERLQGRFERVLELPAEGTGEGIKASYQNGVLEIVIPKKEKAKGKEVKIKVL